MNQLADLVSDRLNQLFDQAPVAMGIVRGDQNVVTLANPAMCHIWGHRREELLGRPIFDVLTDARAERFEDLLAQVRRTEVPFVGRELPITLPRPDGGVESIFVNFVYQPIRTGDGPIEDILVVATDVTREVQGRRAAEAVSAEFEAMFNSIPDGAYLGDESGIRRANQAGLAVLGVDNVEALRSPTADLLRRFESREASTGRPVPPERSALRRSLAGETVRDEYIVRHSLKGHDVRLRTVASPIRVGDRITGAVIMNTDITEAHRAIEALQASEENFRTLAKAIPQQVWTAKPDGALDFVNERVADYFGVSRDHVLGAGWQDVIHSGDLPGCVERWTHSLTTGDEYEVEFRLKRADGTYRWHLGRALAVRDAAGAIVKWFGTNTDIDDLKRVREELEKRTEFEQHLAGIVSHDLRNPLAVILMGAASLLRMENQSERTTKIALRIQTSAERSARMISDLLDFTQARLGGGIRVQRRPADLYTLAATAVDEAEAAFPDRDIELTRTGDTQGTWDADRLGQVITNLTTNALKYSPQGTPVSIHVAGRETDVELAVRNEGPAIPEERLGRLFEPLQRASDEIDRHTRSLGLGLYIVDSIVRAHGGAVGVLSTDDAGTTFRVRLPREAVTR
jgi:PAS domain S-box-containing protein